MIKLSNGDFEVGSLFDPGQKFLIHPYRGILWRVVEKGVGENSKE